MRFSRADLEAFRGRTLPDLVGPTTRLLFVGFNPGLRSVAVGTHFGGGSNRFYPALHRAGITDRLIDASQGMRPEDGEHLIARGVGITSLVAGASARADELTRVQLREGATSLISRLKGHPPAVIAILGLTAYRIAFDDPGARLGPQVRRLAGAATWVVPNPSGLNRRTSLDDLATAYRRAALVAGIEP